MIFWKTGCNCLPGCGKDNQGNEKTEHIKLLYGLSFYSLEEAGCENPYVFLGLTVNAPRALILSANSICKMSLSKTQFFLFFESGAVYGAQRSPFCFRTAAFRSQRPPIF